MVDSSPVLILSGGLGTRMSSLYPDIPKAMIPINGKPLIAHQLRLLARERVRNVILCVGYRYDPLVEYVGSGEAFGVCVHYSYDGEKLLGTGGAIRKASQELNVSFAVLYGDSYLDVSFEPIFEAFRRSNKSALMTVYRNNNCLIPSNILYLAGSIIDYNKAEPTEAMKHIDYGLSVFNPQSFKNFPIDEAFDLGDVFQDLIKKNLLAAYEVKERFYEAGSPQGLKELSEYLAAKGKASM